MKIAYFVYLSTKFIVPKRTNCLGPSPNKICVELALGSSLVIVNYKFNTKTTFPTPFYLK